MDMDMRSSVQEKSVRKRVSFQLDRQIVSNVGLISMFKMCWISNQIFPQLDGLLLDYSADKAGWLTRSKADSGLRIVSVKWRRPPLTHSGDIYSRYVVGRYSTILRMYVRVYPSKPNGNEPVFVWNYFTRDQGRIVHNCQGKFHDGRE